MTNTPSIVDLFCGCGGFGLGAELAGFQTLAAVDVDKTLQSAYQFNFPNTTVVNGDLATMDESNWHQIINNRTVDGVIGGPPCQGFSRIGRNDPDDPRKSLLAVFFKHINILQPKFFIMENVEGLLDANNRQHLKNAIDIVNKRYTVLDPFLVDASQFGAPTKRKRVIVIGYDSSFFSKPLLSDDFIPKPSSVSVKEAIADLPSPLNANTTTAPDFGWKAYRDIAVVSKYAKRMKKRPRKGLGNTEAKEKLLSGLTSGHLNTIHTAKVQSRYDTLEQGNVDKISKSKRLHWDGLCPTLRAGTGSDKGSHQAVRPIHPSEPRVITVREAARLQGFPDWFCFHSTKWHSFRMIGNSVSPIVSQKILEVIKKRILTQPVRQGGQAYEQYIS